MYRFVSSAQWGTGLTSGFSANAAGGLSTIVRLTRKSTAITSDRAATRIATSTSLTLWRVAGVEAQRLDALGSLSGVGGINSRLAASPRWLVDRDSVWAFDCESFELLRFDVDTLDLIDTLSLRAACGVRGPDSGSTVRDIARDGHRGVWILLTTAHGARLVHVDCHGRPAGQIELPCSAAYARELAVLVRAARFVLLTEDRTHLLFFDASGSELRGALYTGDLDIDWRVTRLSDNGVDLVVLAGHQGSGKPVPRVFVLDAGGEKVDGPIDVFPDTQSGGDPPLVHDVSASAGAVFLATSKGVRQLTQSAASESPQQQSLFVTPALVSPERDARRGWLRAELVADLPPGAVVEARFGATSDDEIYRRYKEWSRSATAGSAAARRAQLWAALDADAQNRFVFAAADVSAGVPIMIPLFGAQDRYLWLELAVLAPPGSGSVRLTELRVLYPDISLIERLPAIYRDERRDPTGVLRRFVGTIESTTQNIDVRIGTIAAALDPSRAPKEWLDYMAQWFDMPWDATLPLSAKRALLGAAADLIAERGTRAGLQRLLDSIFGAGQATFVDVNTDVSVARLGCSESDGVRLPALLAGMPLNTAVLGEKAVLGRARLRCPDRSPDPLTGLSGWLQITIAASPDLRKTLEPILGELLAQFLPAGMTVRVRWRPAAPGSSNTIGEGFVLDDRGPARVGTDAPLGRRSLAGKPGARLDEPGSARQFRLQ